MELNIGLLVPTKPAEEAHSDVQVEFLDSPKLEISTSDDVRSQCLALQAFMLPRNSRGKRYVTLDHLLFAIRETALFRDKKNRCYEEWAQTNPQLTLLCDRLYLLSRKPVTRHTPNLRLGRVCDKHRLRTLAVVTRQLNFAKKRADEYLEKVVPHKFSTGVRDEELIAEFQLMTPAKLAASEEGLLFTEEEHGPMRDNEHIPLPGGYYTTMPRIPLHLTDYDDIVVVHPRLPNRTPFRMRVTDNDALELPTMPLFGDPHPEFMIPGTVTNLNQSVTTRLWQRRHDLGTATDDREVFEVPISHAHDVSYLNYLYDNDINVVFVEDSEDSDSDQSDFSQGSPRCDGDTSGEFEEVLIPTGAKDAALNRHAMDTLVKSGRSSRVKRPPKCDDEDDFVSYQLSKVHPKTYRQKHLYNTKPLTLARRIAEPQAPTLVPCADHHYYKATGFIGDDAAGQLEEVHLSVRGHRIVDHAMGLYRIFRDIYKKRVPLNFSSLYSICYSLFLLFTGKTPLEYISFEGWKVLIANDILINPDKWKFTEFETEREETRYAHADPVPEDNNEPDLVPNGLFGTFADLGTHILGSLDSLVDSELYHRFVRFLAVLVAKGYMADTSFDNLFSTTTGLLYSSIKVNVTPLSLITDVGKFLAMILKKVDILYENKNVSFEELLYFPDSYQDYIMKHRSLLSRNVPFAEKAAYAAECEKLLVFARKLRNKLEKSPRNLNIVRVMDQRIAEIERVYDKTLSDVSAATNRVVPVVFAIQAVSGVGKSSVMEQTIQFASGSAGISCGVENRWHKNDGDKFADGLEESTRQQIFIFDDVDCFKHTTVESASAQLQMLIRTINNVPYLTNQASLDSKGKRFVQAKVVMLTTNSLVTSPNPFGIATYYKHTDAVYRRIPFAVEPRVKKAFRVMEGQVPRLDSSKISEYKRDPEAFCTRHNLLRMNHVLMDYWEYDIYKYMDGKYTLVSTFTNVEDYAVFVHETTKQHFLQQEQVVSALSVDVTGGFCANCKLPGASHFPRSENDTTLVCGNGDPFIPDKYVDFDRIAEIAARQNLVPTSSRAVNTLTCEMFTSVMAVMRAGYVPSLWVFLSPIYFWYGIPGVLFVTLLVLMLYSRMGPRQLYYIYDVLQCAALQIEHELKNDFVRTHSEVVELCLQNYRYLSDEALSAWLAHAAQAYKAKLMRNVHFSVAYERYQHALKVLGMLAVGGLIYMYFKSSEQELEPNGAALVKHNVDFTASTWRSEMSMQKAPTIDVDVKITSPDQMKDTLLSRMLRISIQPCDRNGDALPGCKTRHVNAVCVKGEMLASVMHVFRPDYRDGTECEYPIFDYFRIDCYRKDKSTGRFHIQRQCETIISRSMMVFHDKLDLAFFTLSVPTLRSIYKLLPEGPVMFTGKAASFVSVSSKTGLAKELGRKCLKMSNSQYTCGHARQGLTFDTTGFMQCDLPSLAGDCGGPMYVIDQDQCWVGGIICAGGNPAHNNYVTAVAIPINQAIVDEYFDRLVKITPDIVATNLAIVQQQSFDVDLRLTDPVPNSVYNTIEDGCGEFQASTNILRKKRSLSKVTRSVFFEDLSAECPELVSDKEAPVMRPVCVDGEWRDSMHTSAVLALTRTVAFPQSDLQSCTKELLDHIMSNPTVKRDVRTHVQPLDLYQAINGIPGFAALTSLPMKTACGPPFTGAKRKFFVDDPRPNYPDGVMLDEGMLAQCVKLEASLHTDFCAPMISAATLKDEPISPAKNQAARVRVFYVTNFLYNLLGRKYMLTTLRVMMMHRDIFCGMVGLNLESLEWASLYHQLTKFNKFLFGDFSKFDTSLWQRILTCASTFFYRMCSESGNYTPEELRVTKTLIDLFVCVHVSYDGDIIQLNGLGISGAWWTTWLNTIVNLIAHYYCFKQEYPLCGPQDFYSGVRLALYGDDSTGSVSEEFPDFNMVTISRNMARLGLNYTDGDKTGSVKPYITVDEVQFCSRSFRSDDGILFAPLKWESICKTVSLFVRSLSMSVEQQSIVCLQECLTHLVHYGEDKYEHYRIIFERILDKHRLTISCVTPRGTHPGFLTWREAWDQLRSRSYTAVPQVQSSGYIVLSAETVELVPL